MAQCKESIEVAEGDQIFCVLSQGHDGRHAPADIYRDEVRSAVRKGKTWRHLRFRATRARGDR